MRETRFSDVCGTINEIRNILSRSTLKPEDFTEALDLLEDASYMISRMKHRLREYEKLRGDLRRLLEEMDRIEPKGVEEVPHVVEEFKKIVSTHPQKESDLKRAIELAEKIRKIAGSLEDVLRTYKEKCLDMLKLYGRIKGVRDWSRDEEKVIGVALPILMPLNKLLEDVYEWLPPEPHRTKLIEFIKAGRAYILPKKRRQPPMVYFEDGGSIPLHKVRYSDKIRNFYPEDKPPLDVER